MKTVLMCDFCHHTENLDSKGSMIEHEKTCTFNPKNKTCYTCKNKLHTGHGNEGCSIGLDFVEGEDEGNCKGWKYK